MPWTRAKTQKRNHLLRIRDGEDEDSDDECQECSNTPTAPEGRGVYKPGDQCKRHRNRDNDDYSESVSSYRRRKPK